MVSTDPLKLAAKPGNLVLLLELFIKNIEWHNYEK